MMNPNKNNKEGNEEETTKPAGGGCCGGADASCLPALSPSFVGNRQQQQQQGDQRQGVPTGAHAMQLKEMNNMNNMERQKVYDEVHGVGQSVEETPQLLEQSVAAMKAALQGKGDSRAAKMRAFQRAKFLVPTRVYDPRLLRMFLRCEEFQIDKAVQRYLKYYEFSLKMFGVDGILHDCRQEDLDQDDMDMLRTGTVIPMWNARDRSGRLVVFFHTDSCRFKHYMNYLKSAFYLFWKTLQDPEVQKKGVVLISWNLPVNDEKPYMPPMSPAMVQDSIAFFACLPIRICSAHCCYDSSAFSLVLEYCLTVIGRAGRIRSRTWCGSLTECKYNLLTFGIDVAKFPLTTEGVLDKTVFHQWILDEGRAEDQQRLQETDTSHSPMIVEPTSKDVLLGRGIPFRSFPGNLMLGKIAQESWPAYQALPASSPNKNKSLFYRQILRQLHEKGSRILDRTGTDQPWQVATEKQALQRISKSIRNKNVVDQYHQTKKS